MIRLSQILRHNKAALDNLLATTYQAQQTDNASAQANILEQHENHLKNQNFKFLQVLAYNRFQNTQILNLLNFSIENKDGDKTDTFNAEKVRLKELERFLSVQKNIEHVPDEWKQDFGADVTSTLAETFGNSPDQLHRHLDFVAKAFHAFDLETDEINQIIAEVPELIYDQKWQQSPELPTGDNLLEWRLNGMLDRNVFPFFRQDIKVNLITAPRAWLISPMSYQLAKLFYLMRDMNLAPSSSSAGKTKRKRSHLIQRNQTSKISYGGLLSYSLAHIQARHQFLARRGDYSDPNIKGVVEGNDRRNPSALAVITTSDEEFIRDVCRYPEDQESLDQGLEDYIQFKKILYLECLDALDQEAEMEDNSEYNEFLHRKFNHDNGFHSHARTMGRNDYDRRKMEAYIQDEYEKEALSENALETTVANMIRADL